MFTTTFLNRLLHFKKRNLWLITVVIAILLTELATIGINLLQIGSVPTRSLVNGIIISVFVASLISGVIFYFLSELNKLIKNNTQLDLIISSCPVPIALNDDKHNIVMLNPEFTNLFGYTLEDVPVLEQWWIKAYPNESYRKWVENTWLERLNIMKMSGNPFESLEVNIQCKNGLSKSVLATATALPGIYSNMNLVVLYDITERAAYLNQLSESRNVLQSIIETIPMRVFWKDQDSRYLGCNTAFAEDGGEPSPENIIGKVDAQLTWKDQAELYRADDKQVMTSGTPKLAFDEPQTTPDGNHIWLRTSKVPLKNSTGETFGILGIYQDISEQKIAESELRIAASAFESQEGMIITDANSVILKANKSFSRITGYSSDDLVGQKMSMFKSGVHNAEFYAEMWSTINAKGSWQGEVWNCRKNGEIFPEWLTITAVKDKSGTITNYVGALIDITNRKAIEEQVYHLAHHDALTDLPNRVLLTDRMRQALAAARRDKEMLAVLYLDLDMFKPVNDTLGHDIGDLLLKEIAYRLLACVKRGSDTVSRMGGDEFVILLSQIEAQNDAGKVADKILFELNLPFLIEQHTIHISTSIGIAIYPENGTDVTTLLKNSDNAMYQAKNAGRSCYKYFSPE